MNINISSKMCSRTLLFSGALLVLVVAVYSDTAFEKLTELDYRGSTYYTIRNLSLWECQGWCREEPECAAASFSFVMNPLAPVQETLCLLQNETMASNPSADPQRAVSLYYMVKLSVRSYKVCKRPWTFERVPHMMLKDLDDARIFTSTKEGCLAACLNESKFKCRSAEYNYVTLQCQLSQHDRRSAGVKIQMVETKGVDYFENLCLSSSESCSEDREYLEPELGVSGQLVSHYVDMHYYVDKELMANSVAACKRACEIENEFLCRSFLYKGPPTGTTYNCQLFHLDHYTLPDGPSTFLSTDRPLLDDGQRTGTYYENSCKGPYGSSTGGLVTPVPAGYTDNGDVFTSLGGSSSSSSSSSSTGGSTLGGGSGSSSSSSSYGTTISGQGTTGRPTGENVNCDPTGVCYDVSVHCKDTRIVVEVNTNQAFNGRIYALGRSETCNVQVVNSDKFRLDLSMAGQDCNTQSANGVYTNTVVIQHHSIVMTKTDKIYKIRCTYDMTSKNITFGMLPIRDPDMIPITSAPEAPPPRIRILDAALREVETVRIGDTLTFRIEIPEATPYGIFARSCVAMAKDSRSTFQIIDDDGCPVEPSIFPQFTKDGSALQCVYEAFRFTESYGVIFQCNVKYCLGPCEPVRCQMGREKLFSWGRKRRNTNSSMDAWGHVLETIKDEALVASRKRRGVKNSKGAWGQVQETTKEEALAASQALASSSDNDEMSISQEILVLDLGDDQSPQYRSEPVPEATRSYHRNNTYTFEGADVTLFETCPTRSSVLALAVTCAILLLIYVLTVFYFVMRKWLRPPKNVR
ncbi:uncharacterized protein tyn isoform X2 [Procambarus clarkii]|uniref:uncharacterized protein tyn isoform X2 n=1 Tax=Procambarus clarkii TaxID=6728 RepID=UPI003743B13D